MNKRKLEFKRNMVWRLYKNQATADYTRVKRNVCKLHQKNSKSHEMAKAEVCFILLREGFHYITECFDKVLKERNDIVCLDTGMKFEVESTRARARRFAGRDDVKVIKLWKGQSSVEEQVMNL